MELTDKVYLSTCCTYNQLMDDCIRCCVNLTKYLIWIVELNLVNILGEQMTGRSLDVLFFFGLEFGGMCCELCYFSLLIRTVGLEYE